MRVFLFRAAELVGMDSSQVVVLSTARNKLQGQGLIGLRSVNSAVKSLQSYLEEPSAGATGE